MGSHFINESDIDTWWKQETRPAPLSSASRYHVVGPPTTNTTSRRMRADGNNQTFWLTVWSSPSGSPFIPPSLEIVLSCVNWTLGDLPIILWTPRDPASLSASWLIPRIELLAKGLLNIVPPSRVFYILGMTKLVKSSTRYWSDLVRYPIEPESLYAAYYSFCKRETFRQSYDPLPRGDSIRCANMEDLPQVAQLCKEFADDSVGNTHLIAISAILIRLACVDIFSARYRFRYCRSAGAYFEFHWPRLDLRVGRRSGFLFVRPRGILKMCLRSLKCTRRANGDAGDLQSTSFAILPGGWSSVIVVSCLILNLISISPDFCSSTGKHNVTLYVEHNNSAQSVCDRVGFVGLCGKESVNGVEDSMELGQVTGARKGHW